jgi:predicted nucleic acid-binding protein
MAYSNIQKLRNCRVEPIKYFIDANVWIYSMQNFHTLERWQQGYANFFFEIIDSDLQPKPKIIVPSLLISEIINTYLKQIAFKDYKKENGITTNIDFKRDYRPTQHYKDSLEKVCDDLLSYKASIEFVNDDILIKNPDIMLNIPSTNFDYNDYFYYRLCQHVNSTQPLSMITNDGDFLVSDLNILTENRDLLSA